ncbi:PepSY domain-containing protein [Roseococcus sp. SDR]|uniref:PepSY domain-containing protein n=1 Tax=Roseococcus sp. SDR TaxID=2835532 RepID=UPI001BCD3FBE|nr:PepSY domain-containing protein [Roseococcus sp. SDR]MBS7792672.1 PepSY domain-containing protein [Roseococcus sp. SDR]MBV1847986.1 PepSY domain-containing protein [Roseococcus sp. SDR]
MFRRLHSLPGLLAALLITALALTGAFLAFDSVLERSRASIPAPGEVTVAALADAVQQRHAEVERIVRTPSGSIIAYYFENDLPGAELVDPNTGAAIGPHEPSNLTRSITNLHRSFLMDDAGRVAAGLGAAAMLVLCLSGAIVLAARLGGWAAILRPSRGSFAQRLHCELGRAAMAGLLLSALTGCWMSLATFGVLPDGTATEIAAPVEPSGAPRLRPGQLAALQAVDLSALRELTFPYGDDLTDSYTLTSAQGIAHIDAATGQALDFVPNGLARRVHETIVMLHTGRGVWPLALLLGLAVLTAPLLAGAGAVIWWHRRAARPRIRHNAAAQSADTILLVGSEGNSSWGFAATLHAALTRAGHRVHAAPMNALAPRYAKAQRLLILTATYGDGSAPASAGQFLQRLERATHPLPFAVLGFGDRAFPRFCGFAETVAAALQNKGWPMLLETGRIDRQSAQGFAAWGEALGAALGVPLALAHLAQRPRTRPLVLAQRVEYGAESQTPTAILRFVAPPGAGLWRRRLPRFEAGDLVGILAPGTEVPRFYSLASASADGALEICVRKQAGGLCSGFLHELPEGGRIEVFIRPNPAFRPGRGRAPVILVGAGTGIGPLAGFIRHNAGHRPMHLYWGGRHPGPDFLYGPELRACVADGRLARLNTTFSRVPGGGYVQQRLAADAAALRELLQRGGQVLVCGGRDMAGGVATAFEAILQPLGLDLATLKSEGRYLEDVY